MIVNWKFIPRIIIATKTYLQNLKNRTDLKRKLLKCYKKYIKKFHYLLLLATVNVANLCAKNLNGLQDLYLSPRQILCILLTISNVNLKTNRPPEILDNNMQRQVKRMNSIKNLPKYTPLDCCAGGGKYQHV